jgi:signal transduction histidine kinase
VFVNQIRNALEAMPGGGAVAITAMETAGHVPIATEDSSPGIPAAIRSRVANCGRSLRRELVLYFRCFKAGDSAG